MVTSPSNGNGNGTTSHVAGAPARWAPATRRGERQRALVIGLDGATFDLIEPWVAEGALPTFSRLLSEGTHGRLLSTIPPMTAPAWTSLATGTNPGKHALFDWVGRRPGTYRFEPLTALDCRAPTLYELLSQSSRRVCVLNVPMTYPPTPVNGVMVSGMPAPSASAGVTYPASLYGEMIDAIGDYVIYPDPGQAYSDAGVDAFLKRLYKAAELRIRAFDYLRSREDWDFAMAVFNGTDTVCHAMWKYMDPSHPLHDASRFAKYGSAIKDYYRYIDTYLGRIVANLDDQTTLFIVSDHGMGPFHKFIHVNNWLMDSGFMRVKPAVRSRMKRALFSMGFTPMNVYDLLMRFGLGGLKREVVRGNGQDLLKALFLSFEDVDWSQTQAYSLGNVGQININVVGREPMGCVQPGEEYERVRSSIIAQLANLEDPQTGERVVESIYHREEVYSGDELEHAPDIMFIPRRLEYFGFGEYEFGSNQVIESMRRGISGTHRMRGVFMAYGASIRPGLRLADPNIVDVAPTILSLMGESVPDQMDGRPLQEMLVDGFIPVRGSNGAGGSWQPSGSGHAVELTDAEQAVIAERLRGLGYVG